MDYSTSTSYSTTDPAAVGAIVAAMGVVWLISMIYLIIVIVGMWKTYVKAGEPGWASIIPFYNIYIWLKIIGRPGWWLLLFFVPFVNFVVTIMISLDLAKAFGKSTAFGIVALWLFSPVGFLILGFGPAKYVGAPNKA